MNVKNLFLFIVIFVFTNKVFAQNNILISQGGTVSVSTGDKFYDAGGAGGNDGNADHTITLCPAVAGERVAVDFTSFCTMWKVGMFDDLDPLFIYDGTDKNAPLIGELKGNFNIPLKTSVEPYGMGVQSTGIFSQVLTPTIFSAQNSTGCLTFWFDNQVTDLNPGWEAVITTFSAPDNPGCFISLTPDTSICGNGSVDLLALGSLITTPINSDFNDSTVGQGWNATSSASFSMNLCGSGSLDASTFLWMQNAGYPRALTTNSMDVSAGGIISFEYKQALGNGNGSPCEAPDRNGSILEGVYIQYSTDGGTNWNTFKYMYPNATEGSFGWEPSLCGCGEYVKEWTKMTYPIPVAAQTNNTMFRWIQAIGTNASTDNWGLDNIIIALASNDPFTITITDETNGGAVIATGNNSTLSATVNPAATTVYRATIDNGTSSCFEEVTITISDLQTSKVENDESSCGAGDGSATVSVSSGNPNYTYVWKDKSGNTVRNSGAIPNASDNLTNMSADLSPYIVEITDNSNCSNTETVNISSPAGATITLHPQNILNCDGGDANFSITSTDANTYQWQVDKNDGNGWVDLANNAVYAGVTTANLDITGADNTMNGYLYRCVVNDATPVCSVTSNSAILEISEPNFLNPIYSAIGANNLIEGCSDATITIHLDNAASTDRIIELELAGTALINSDYFTSVALSGIPSINNITIPTGQTDFNIDFIAIDDGLPEGTEEIILYLRMSSCVGNERVDTLIIHINDMDNYLFNISCGIQTANSFQFLWDSLQDISSYDISYKIDAGVSVNVGVINDTNYIVNGTNGASQVEITINASPSNACIIPSTVSCPLIVCDIVSNYSFVPECFGIPIVFTDISTDNSGTINNWKWDFGDGTPISNLQNPTHNYAAAGNYNVKLVITDDNIICKDSITKVVTVSDAPDATLSGGGTICGNGSQQVDLQIDFNTGVSPFAFECSNGTTIISKTGITDNPYVFGVNESGTYNITSLSSGGCNGTFNGSAVVVINQMPQKFNLLSTNNGQYCDGDLGVNLTLSGSEVGVNYRLQRDGINIGSIVAGTGSVLDFGIFSVVGSYSVIATNAITGCVSLMNASISITKQALPNRYNLIGGGSFCKGDNGVNISLQSSQIGVSYQLINSSNNIVSTLNGTGNLLDFGLVSDTGTYIIKAIDDITLCEVEMFNSILVSYYPQPQIYSLTGGGNFCQGDAGLSVGLAGSEVGVNYELFINGVASGNIIAGTGSSIDFGVYSSPALFTVVATNTVNNCSETMNSSVSISYYPNPTADFSFNSVCNGELTQFTDRSTVSSGNISQWDWTFGDLATSNTRNPSHQYALSGSFNVTLKVTTNNSCESTISKLVTVFGKPFISNVSTTIVNCYGECTGTATATVVGSATPFTYNWNQSNTSNLNQTSNLCSGNHHLIVTDANGCTGESDFTINQNSKNKYLQTSNPPICIDGCNGKASVLIIGNNGPYSYSWLNLNSNEDTLNNLCPGSYSVTITDNNQCDSTINIIVPNSTYIPDITALANNYYVPYGDNTFLYGVGDLGYTYSWSPVDYLNQTNTDTVIYTALEEIEYTLSIIDSNGCISSDTVFVNIIRNDCNEPYIFVPNSFTPNNDLKNDILYVRGEGIIKDFIFVIYDRWGEKVFESTDLNVGWDGFFNNNEVISGVYTYYLKANCFDNETYTKSGNITVIR